MSGDRPKFSPKIDFHIYRGSIMDIEPLIKKYHYSKRLPGNIQLVLMGCLAGGLLGDRGDPVAGIILSIPPTRWSEYVWELSRLVRVDDIQINLTQLISQCMLYVKTRKLIDLIVSFADSTMGHHGGIYQAASWNYAGKRDKQMDGVLINGRFYPGRSCNSKWGTRSPSKLSELLKAKVLPHYDEGKHLYWKSLSRTGEAKAANLGLSNLPYPKPKLLKEL